MAVKRSAGGARSPWRPASGDLRHLSDVGAAAVGLLWPLGRVLYATGYSRAVEGRPGFLIQSSACILLFLGAAFGGGRSLLGD